jgi:hypothetical protein
MTVYSIGQDNNLSIGLTGSIGVNNYYFKGTGFNYEYNSKIGYSYGLGFHYFIGDKIFIISGLEHFTQGYQINYNYTFMDPGDPAIPRHSDLSVSYLTIPIMIGFQSNDISRIRFNPSVGINLSFQVNENERTIYEDNSEKESELLSQNLNHAQVMLKMNFGIEYHLSNRFKIMLDPYIGKGLNKLDTKSMKSGQFSYGSALAIYVKF